MRRRFTDNQNTPFDYVNYMTIEALEDGLFVSFNSFITNTIDYCIDGQNWKKLAINENSEAINTGQRISFRGKLQPNTRGIGNFSINKNCKLVGNAMSLLFGDNASSNFSLEGKDRCFYKLFEYCSTIQSVSANFLPATTLAHECYSDMFNDCTNLTTAPELPATTLANRCYTYMFYGCSKLNYIKMLATDISAYDCLWVWVKNVASTGTFVKNPAMTSLPTGTSGIPSG